MNPVPILVAREGPLEGQAWVITEEGLRIGRDTDSEIALDDAGISRQHARVILHEGILWVQDAGSRNGVFVNDERLADHRQLQPGDILLVGSQRFEVGLADPAEMAGRPPPRPAAGPAPAAPAAGARGGSPKGFKAWPFVVAVGLVCALVCCCGLYGKFRGGDEPAPAAPPKPAAAGGGSGGNWSLRSMIEEAPGGAAATVTATPAPAEAPGAGGAGPSTARDALAAAVGQDEAAKRAALPDAPPGTSSDELVQAAHALYESGRTLDARTRYQMALKLDPGCEICAVRIERLDIEIRSAAEQQLDQASRAYDSMSFASAVAACESVLQLAPNPSDPLHIRAADLLERARARARGAP